MPPSPSRKKSTKYSKQKGEGVKGVLNNVKQLQDWLRGASLSVKIGKNICMEYTALHACIFVEPLHFQRPDCRLGPSIKTA